MRDMNLIKVFAALSNPTRLQILREVIEESCNCENLEDNLRGNCVTKISEKLSLPQSSVSNQLKELVNSGLILKKRKGRNIFLFPNKKTAQILKEFADDFRDNSL